MTENFTWHGDAGAQQRVEEADRAAAGVGPLAHRVRG
jgi:hypothetical protein